MSLKGSVIIPTHNRCSLLRQVLLALSQQTISVSDFEVIVVLDGEDQETEFMLQQIRNSSMWPNLFWYAQPQKGPAAARNAGVHQAKAEIILFLDDDIIPSKEWLQSHLEMHDGAKEAVIVFGDYPLNAPDGSDLALLELWRWWQHAFWLRRMPDRQSQFRDFLSGNFSMQKSHFISAGGFDPSFRFPGREDYDLGYRLLQSGARFLIANQAAAIHHRHQIFTTRTLKRISEIEAAGDLRIARKHPDLRSSIRCCRKATGRYKLLAWLAFSLPSAGSIFLLLLMLQGSIERLLKARRSWLASYKSIRQYLYWRNIRKAGATREEIRQLQSSVSPNIIKIDISDGLPEMLPDSQSEATKIEIFWREQLIGTIGWREPRAGTMHENLAREIAERFALEIAAVINKTDITDGTRKSGLSFAG